MLAVAFVAVVGCVRLDPPTTFGCDTVADCQAGEKCAFGACLAADQCRFQSDCSETQRCDMNQGRCVAAECYPGHEDVCGGYACVEGVCRKFPCSPYGDCRSGFTCDVSSSMCKPPPKSSGESCTSSLECLSNACCGPPGDQRCGFCFANFLPCQDAYDCLGGFCCPLNFGKECRSSACATP